MDKKSARLRRAKRTRIKLREMNTVRLTVTRSSQHIYAQIISGDGSQVLASASTVEKEMRDKATGNAEAATAVGKLIAERAKTAGIDTVAFDRSGYQYHGRVKALADAAREAGLQF